MPSKDWHPEPRDPLVCEHCEKEFRDNGRMVNGMPVAVRAENYLQIHHMAYSYQGQVGMCALDEKERTAIMVSAPLPNSQEA